MREILFRGKAKDGKWYFGDLVQFKSGYVYIQSKEEGESNYVIPETVGQFTGLTDKNGKKIFEHDIVYIKFQEPTSKVTGEKPIYTIIFEKGCFSLFRKTNRIVVFDLRVWYKECEVIGNIHDNPELLEVQE